jgi:hypothetical protein
MHSSERDLLQAQNAALKESANAMRNDLEEIAQQVIATFRISRYSRNSHVDAARPVGFGQ